MIGRSSPDAISDPCRLYCARCSAIECHTSMPETTYLKAACQHCKGHIEYPSEFAGQSVECPHCKQTTTLPPSTPPPPLPVINPVKASIEKASSFAGVGCLLQGIGAVCFVLAILTFKTAVILSIVFGILGLWLLFYGSRKASWYRCSVCGGKLSHARVSVCPHCNARFRE
jgi:DNA-directed RNA polymerase subunit RPC12/RpoP